MTLRLPDLPFAPHDLEPHLSARTVALHHGKHHAGYVDKVNELLAVSDSQDDDVDLEALVKRTNGPLFEAAAQAANHALYWESIGPGGGGEPPAKLRDALTSTFGSVDAFREEFTAKATGHFGSGWAWLTQTRDGRLAVETTHDAGTPLLHGRRPLLTCDVWEHAYYLDHQNERDAYLRAFWEIVDWEKVEGRLTWTPAHAEIS